MLNSAKWKIRNARAKYGENIENVIKRNSNRLTQEVTHQFGMDFELVFTPLNWSLIEIAAIF